MTGNLLKRVITIESRSDVDLLFEISQDPSEHWNLITQNQAEAMALKEFVSQYDAIVAPGSIAAF